MERGNRISCPQVPTRSRDVPQQESLNALQSGAAPAKGKEGAAHEQGTRDAKRKTRRNWRTKAPPNPIINSLKDKIDAEEENPTNKKKSEMEENHKEQNSESPIDQAGCQ